MTSSQAPVGPCDCHVTAVIRINFYEDFRRSKISNFRKRFNRACICVFACEYGVRGSGVNDLEDGLKMDKIIELFKKTETKRREKLLENLEINFDVLRREEAVEIDGE